MIVDTRLGATSLSPKRKRRVVSRDSQMSTPSSSPAPGRHHIARRVNAGWSHGMPRSPSYSSPATGRHRIARRVNAGWRHRMPKSPPQYSSPVPGRHHITQRVNAGWRRRLPRCTTQTDCRADQTSRECSDAIRAADGRACHYSPRTSQIAPAGSRRCQSRKASALSRGLPLPTPIPSAIEIPADPAPAASSAGPARRGIRFARILRLVQGLRIRIRLVPFRQVRLLAQPPAECHRVVPSVARPASADFASCCRMNASYPGAKAISSSTVISRSKSAKGRVRLIRCRTSFLCRLASSLTDPMS